MALHGLRHDDRAMIDRARREAAAGHNRTSPDYVVLDRLFVLAGHPPTSPACHGGPPSEEAVAESRWRTIFESLLQRRPDRILARGLIQLPTSFPPTLRAFGGMSATRHFSPIVRGPGSHFLRKCRSDTSRHPARAAWALRPIGPLSRGSP